MADEPKTLQPISDDQELAKVLAGVTNDEVAAEEPIITTPIPDPIVAPAPPVEEPVAPVVPDPVMPDLGTPSSLSSTASSGSSDLDSIKLEALGELRPLVDKLNVSPEEKFDTYLLLLRSTDDKALIAPAHDAAKAIADEARRAQALLDIIKEIDFLSQPNS